MCFHISRLNMWVEVIRCKKMHFKSIWCNSEKKIKSQLRLLDIKITRVKLQNKLPTITTKIRKESSKYQILDSWKNFGEPPPRVATPSPRNYHTWRIYLWPAAYIGSCTQRVNKSVLFPHECMPSLKPSFLFAFTLPHIVTFHHSNGEP